MNHTDFSIGKIHGTYYITLKRWHSSRNEVIAINFKTKAEANDWFYTEYSHETMGMNDVFKIWKVESK